MTRIAKRPDRIDPKILSDLLLLVGYDISPEVVRSWTPEEQHEAEEWAAKTHLRASDNPVRVPPKPDFLDAYNGNVFSGFICSRNMNKKKN